MFKRIARAIVPGRLRRWLQRRKLERLVANYPRRVAEHRYGEVVLKVELADPLAAGWYDHDWEPLPEVVLLGRHRLRPAARVFDIGAHQGVVGLMLGHRVGPTGRVIVVEPNPHNVAMCARNAELNAMAWVTAHQAAISDHEGTILFSGGLNGTVAELNDYAGVIQVPAVTIDGLTDRYGPPDVVLLDVEGFECRALAGARRTFAARSDWSVEVHLGCGLEEAGGSVEQVLAYFPEAEFVRYVHSPGDPEPVLLESAPPGKLRRRFFLTAVARNPGAELPRPALPR